MIRLKELRKARLATQQDAADKLGLERVSYARYENGTRIPSIEALEKLADFYGVTTDYLLERTDIPNVYEMIDVPAVCDQRKAVLKPQVEMPERKQQQSRMQDGLQTNQPTSEFVEMVRKIVREELERS